MKTIKYSFLIFLISLVLTGCSEDKPTGDEIHVSEKEDEIEKDLDRDIESVILERVLSGDLIEFRTKEGVEIVKLTGVDTPDFDISEGIATEPYGEIAKEHTESYFEHYPEIKLKRTHKKDDITYGYVYLSGSVKDRELTLGEILLRDGLARYLGDDEVHSDLVQVYKDMENHAKEEGVNIWTVEGYVTDDGFDISAIAE